MVRYSMVNPGVRQLYLLTGSRQLVWVHGQCLQVICQSLEVSDLPQHGHLLILTHKQTSADSRIYSTMMSLGGDTGAEQQ